MMEKERIQKEVKAYLRPAKRWLNCSRKSKETLYNALVTSADEMFGDNPNASLDELHRYWGSPEALVNNFVDGLDQKEVIKSKRKRKILFVASISLAAVAVVLSFYILVLYLNTNIDFLYVNP